MPSSLPPSLAPLLARPPGPLLPGRQTDLPPLSIPPGAVPLSAVPGLYLLNSDWHSAHLVAQDHEGEEGGVFDYWHALVHRTEGGSEYWNAKWWLSRVSHPYLLTAYSAPNISAARALAKKRVDDVEACVASGEKEGAEELRKIVWEEVKGLVEWCLEHGKR